MSDNDISEFSPDENENTNIKEFNPYENFLDGADKDDENLSTSPLNDEAKITSEEDIDLPDFLKSSVDVSEFRNKVSSNPASAEEPKTDTENNEQNSFQSSADEFNPSEEEKETSYPKKNDENGAQSDSNDSLDTNAIDDKEGNGNTLDEEEDKKFVSKKSFDDASKHTGGKPRVLNKKFLLTVIICVVGGIFLVTFLMPSPKKKNSKKGKPVAEIHHSTDYSSIANRHNLPDEEDAQDTRHYGNTTEVKEKEVEIPPVLPERKDAYTEQNIKHNTGKGSASSSAVEIPDTRNDSLRGKQIAGIKGLTSTQQTYSTDYQQTIEKNTSQAASPYGYTLPTKEEYMKNVVSAYNAAYGNAAGQNNSYAVQNDQTGKNSFYNNRRNSETSGEGTWLGLNTIWEGTIFEATLTSELNTDLPGEITARTAKNIYSSQDGRYLLIPQNSVLLGTYNSSISYAQSRVQVVWNTLIRPDGYRIDLGAMNGTDAKGASGMKGFVNDHPLAYLKAIGLMSVFSIMNTEFAGANANTNNRYVEDVIANSQKVTNELSEKLIERAMNVQPTLKVKAGTKINIVANQTMNLPPVQQIPVTQAYHRLR